MCGRAAQTFRAVQAAAGLLGAGSSSFRRNEHQDQNNISNEQNDDGSKDNYNMSPGMEAQVFCWNNQNNAVETLEKTWGLVPRGGTTDAPLEMNMSMHFSNLMFNARSDTLYEKRTFSTLLHQHKTCLIALEGFFEWKAPKVASEKKQPYFVHSKNKPFLLLAGLWTRVSTGQADKETLDTFTIITTDACPSLTWLHHRMPLMIWDESLALEWLKNSTPRLLKQLEKAAWDSSHDNELQWHAVTTQMAKMSFRSKDAIKPLKQPATVKSFFTASIQAQSNKTSTPTVTKTNKVDSLPASKKRPPTSPSKKSPKKQKKEKSTTPESGSIKAFFSPK